MIIPHVNLGEIGVVGDQNGQALPLSAWTDSLNVRFTPLGIEKIAESTLRIPTTYTFQCFTTKLRNGNVHIFAASRGGLHMYDGAEWFFTPADISEDTLWQFTHWGDTVIFNCPEYAPFMFDWDTVEDPESVPENGYFIPLPKWGIISTEWDLSTGGDPSFDTEARCERLVAYKSQLVAVGLTMKEPIDAELDPENIPEESPVYEKTERRQKNNVVWVSDTTSDPTYKLPEGESGGGADAGISGAVRGGPPSWDYVSPATLAVQQVVGAADGRYIAAEPLNDSIIIYTATAAHALIFTGGQYVVQTRRLFERGIAGPRCVCQFGNNHFVIDGDQLYVHDGSTASRVGEDMFDVEFFKRAINLKTAVVTHDPENREVWIYYDTIYGRKSAIFSYSTGTFGWADGEADSRAITYSTRGYLPQTGAQWGDMTAPWKDYQEPDDYLLWPDDWQGEFGIPLSDVSTTNTIQLWSDEELSAERWRLVVKEDKLLSKPPYKWSIKWKTEKLKFDEGTLVSYDVPTRFLPHTLTDYAGPTWFNRLKINGNVVGEKQLYSGSASGIREWRITWKDDYNPTVNYVPIGGNILPITEPAEFELEVAINIDPSRTNQWEEDDRNNFSWLFVTPDHYKIGSINPLYDGNERWRWIDQFTYTNKPYILANTSFGIYQKEAYFSNERESWVERKAIDLDDAGINGWVIKHLKQYHMQLAGEGKVGIRTGWAESALADPNWEKPTWLDETGDGSYQADMRTSGRYLSLRFEFKEMGYFRWANGYMDIEVSGRR